MAKQNRWAKKSVRGEVYRKLNKDAVRSKDNLPQGVYRRADTSHIKSLFTGASDTCSRNTMMERVHRGEIVGKAAEEIVRKSTCLAPAYNKGAYQYVGSVDEASEAGRKTPKGSER